MCGYQRNRKPPEFVPRCKSPYWHRPRRVNPKTDIAKKLDKISRERLK
jgi:hypothetical protein